jgi:hypothetical protein
MTCVYSALKMVKDAGQIARGHGCFITEKRGQHGLFWLLYRVNPAPDGKPIFLGQRTSAAGIREMVEKICIPHRRRSP